MTIYLKYRDIIESNQRCQYDSPKQVKNMLFFINTSAGKEKGKPVQSGILVMQPANQSAAQSLEIPDTYLTTWVNVV